MNLNKLEKLTGGLKSTEKMPALFLGHGSPMNALEDNIFVENFRKISAEIPRPQAILCISAHWFTEGTFVTSGENQRTIHDFYGFPKELYDVRYPAHGNPELAAATVDLLLPAEVHETEEWGLDHGAWSVLRHLYPDAEIPVIQLSIDHGKSADWHFRLAENLRVLLKKGVLVIGSGNIVHNLRMADFRNVGNIGYGYDWAKEAQEKINADILSQNFKNLINYDKREAAIRHAVPTPDHYLPLLYTLGLADGREGFSIFNDELIAGSLSMTSVRVG